MKTTLLLNDLCKTLQELSNNFTLMHEHSTDTKESVFLYAIIGTISNLIQLIDLYGKHYTSTNQPASQVGDNPTNCHTHEVINSQDNDYVQLQICFPE